jgi:hypothetical protein
MKFHQLEVFLGVSFFTDPEKPNENRDTALDISSRCPKLRRLQHWSQDSRKTKILELIKEGEEVTVVEVKLRNPEAYFNWQEVEEE